MCVCVCLEDMVKVNTRIDGIVESIFEVWHVATYSGRFWEHYRSRF